MLEPRIIPCLLVRNRGLVKTVAFKDDKYVGDPINAVKIFNEKRVDELIIVDIDATRLGKEPDLRMIENVAAECRMPLCYGGGIKSASQAARIFALGVEKIAVSSGCIEQPGLVRAMADEVGSQSVVAVLDVKKKRFFGGYEVWTHNGTRNTKLEPERLVDQLQAQGIGELVINSIDRDGSGAGYDLGLIDSLFPRLSVPVTVLGGAGSLAHIQEVIRRFGTLGVAAGSLFVFKGKFRAVLISYPTREEKQSLCGPTPQAAVTR